MPLNSLRNLPRIMRKQGWSNGARLMDKWFTRGAAVAPSYSVADTSIEIDWVLGYPRARRVYDWLMGDRMWQTANARQQFRPKLQQMGYLRPGPEVRFVPPTSMEELDRFSINELKVLMNTTEIGI